MNDVHCEIVGVHEFRAARARALPRDKETTAALTAFLVEATANGATCGGCGRIVLRTPQRIAIVRTRGMILCSAICPDCEDIEAETFAERAAEALGSGETSEVVAIVGDRRQARRRR